MKIFRCAAFFAAPFCLAFSMPAVAEINPWAQGEYVQVTGVTVDDGRLSDYTDYLAGFWKDEQEFAIAQGWQTSWEVLQNVHKRPGEPDLYLIRRYKNLVDGAEFDRRAALVRDKVKMTEAQMQSASGDRAKFRQVQGTTLMQALKLRK